MCCVRRTSAAPSCIICAACAARRPVCAKWKHTQLALAIPSFALRGPLLAFPLCARPRERAASVLDVALNARRRCSDEQRKPGSEQQQRETPLGEREFHVSPPATGWDSGWRQIGHSRRLSPARASPPVPAIPPPSPARGQRPPCSR